MKRRVQQLHRSADDIWNGFKTGIRDPFCWAILIGAGDMIWIAASH